MTSKEPRKKNLSSVQVLKTLQVLLDGDYTMQELIKKLNSEEEYPIFNNSVISKYINTLRYAGIEIPKIHNKYSITKMPFGLDLSIDEANLLKNLQIVVNNEMPKKNRKIFDGMVDKINRYSNRKIVRVEPEQFKFSFEVFEKALHQKRKVKLLFKNRTELMGIPMKISELGGKTFFHVFNKRERSIDASRLAGIEMTSEQFVSEIRSDNYSVVFTLKNQLAKRYELREHETEIFSDRANGKLTVSNKGENKELLFSRLLRYDINCEIETPKTYREDMKNLLDEMLKNYE